MQGAIFCFKLDGFSFPKFTVKAIIIACLVGIVPEDGEAYLQEH